MVCFLFKPQAAYEMRISDWSSDVCSSDLWRVDDQIIRQDHAERLVADYRTRTRDRVTQAERLGLGHVHATHVLRCDVTDQAEQFVLARADRKSTRLNSSH